MKKTKPNAKLQLNTKTIRILQDSELTAVNGGAPTADCSNLATACSHPPEHTHTSSHPSQTH